MENPEQSDRHTTKWASGRMYACPPVPTSGVANGCDI